MSLKTDRIKQPIVGETIQPLKIGGTLSDGSDAPIIIESNKVVNVPLKSLSTGTAVNYIWSGTQAQYDSIVTKDSNTLYFIV